MSFMRYSCRISELDWNKLRAALFTADGRENAGVLLCGRASAGKEFLLVRDFWTVRDNQYLMRSNDQLEIAPSFYNDIVSRSLRENLSPILVHSHPSIADAWFSLADDRGDLRLLTVLNSLLPNLHPASMVVSEQSAAARRLQEGHFEPFQSIEVLGAASQKIQEGESTAEAEDAAHHSFDRQIRAIGEVGHNTITHLKIAIVGVGGIGSLVAEQLARLGVQDVLVVDDDHIEDVNLNRQYGSKRESIGQSKAAVMQQHMRSLGSAAAVGISDSALRQSTLMRLRDRDVIFACVDNDRTRALLNRFAHQYLVPVIDHGTRLDGRTGTISAASGRVTLVGSGMTCLRCSHHLNPARIQAESMTADERKSLQKEGYIMGIDEPAPAVISLNSVVASLGVTAAINMFAGLTGGAQPTSQIYDATRGNIFTVAPVHDPMCDVCSDQGVKAIGDAAIVSAYD